MKSKLKQAAPGKLVTVDGHIMHVFAAGQGDKTLVFMSGSGTACPTLDFKPLWSLLTDSYKIAVVEKAGYGWSESTGKPRDLDTMLGETRKALKLAGRTPPYVLLPHSLSGLEALYWAQTYPEEVEAIIGLDAAFPEYYDHAKFPMRLIRAMAFLGAITPDMVKEGEWVKENAKKVKEKPFPMDLPAYFFISDGKFARSAKIKNWEEMQREHAAKFERGKHMSLNCGHYVHSQKPEIIAEEIKTFLES